MFERCTDRARKVMKLAFAAADRQGQAAISPQLIALGLVEEGTGVAANVLKNLDVDLEACRHELEATLARGTDAPGTAPAQRPFTHSAKQLLENTLSASHGLQHDYIGTEHLLIALFGLGENPLAEALPDDINADHIRRDVWEFCGHSGEPPPAGTP